MAAADDAANAADAADDAADAAEFAAANAADAAKNAADFAENAAEYAADDAANAADAADDAANAADAAEFAAANAADAAKNAADFAENAAEYAAANAADDAADAANFRFFSVSFSKTFLAASIATLGRMSSGYSFSKLGRANSAEKIARLILSFFVHLYAFSTLCSRKHSLSSSSKNSPLHSTIASISP